MKRGVSAGGESVLGDMVPRLVRALPALVLASLLSGPLSAQGLTSGVIVGTVDAVGARPLYDAVVMAIEVESGFAFGTRSDRLGRFDLSMLPAGDYDVTVEQLGYRSLVLRGIGVRSGRSTELRISLQPATAGMDGPLEQVHDEPLLAGDIPLTSEWLALWRLGGLPEIRRSASGYARASRLFSAGAAEKRLAPALPRVFVDGFSGLSDLPGRTDGGESSTPFPHAGMSAAELIRDPYDPEWADGTGDVIQLHLRPGGEAARAATWGSWSVSSGGVGGEMGGTASTREAGAHASGPLGSAGRYAVAANAIRLEPGLRAIEGETATSRVLRLAESRLPPAETPTVLAGYSAIARLDWTGTGRHRLTSWLRLDSSPRAQGLPPDLPFALRFDGSSLGAAMALTSEIADGVVQELRLSVDATRWGTTDEAAAGAVPHTRIESLGLQLGLPGNSPGRSMEQAANLRQTVHFRAGAVRVKAGLFASVHQFELGWPGTATRSFVFGDAVDFELRNGWFREATLSTDASDFVLARGGVHAQVTWNLGRGLTLVGGTRHEIERLPLREASADTARLWMLGLRAPGSRVLLHRFSPRASLEWHPDDRWRLSLQSGVFHQPLDPILIGEVLRTGFGAVGRSASGALGDWPTPPALDRVPVRGPGALLLPTDYATPRSLGGQLLLSRAVGKRTAVHLGLAARRTYLLPRRRDLNLVDVPWGTDQHGRPLYAPPPFTAESTFTVPGASRRYSEFDQVLAVQADGTSTYRGATLAFEHGHGSPLTLRAAYTLSSIRDDAPRHVAFSPAGFAWTQAPGDLDSPHRALVGGDWTPSLPLHPVLSILYRFDSGLPFTPGIRGGMDVNGDGDAANDPAFVDDHLAGTGELIQAWPCLRSQVGRFADRNSCRRPGIQTLDLGLRLRPVRIGAVNAEFTIEGFAFVGSKLGYYDTALYAIPAGARANVDPATRKVDLPLAANPQFARLVADRTPGPLLRVGLRLLN